MKKLIQIISKLFSNDPQTDIIENEYTPPKGWRRSDWWGSINQDLYEEIKKSRRG